MRGTWILGDIKTPAEVAVSAGVQTDFLKLIARLGCNSGDEGEESKELTAGQDLFQHLQEKELQATLKCILSAPSGAFRLSQPVKTEHE